MDMLIYKGLIIFAALANCALLWLALKAARRENLVADMIRSSAEIQTAPGEV